MSKGNVVNFKQTDMDLFIKTLQDLRDSGGVYDKKLIAMSFCLVHEGDEDHMYSYTYDYGYDNNAHEILLYRLEHLRDKIKQELEVPYDS